MTAASENPANGTAHARGPSKEQGQVSAVEAEVGAALRAPTADPEAARPGLPVKPPLAAVLEILLLIVLPATLDHFIPAFPTLSDMQPHPFWLPVLLVSIQYGTVSGLLAAGCAVAASSFLGYPEQEIGENHFTYLLRVWSQPMLWVAAALVLGQFRMRQIEQKQELARQVAELNNQRKAIAQYATNLRTRCESLEREMVGRREPAGRDLLALLGGMATASQPASARAALGDCLAAAFGKCQASVYARDGEQLRLVEQHGWPTEARWKTTLTATDPLYAAMNGEGRVLSILVPGDEMHLGGEGVAAAPIASRIDGRLSGLLKIEAIEPAEIDASFGSRLMALAIQIAPLLERTSTWPQASVSSVANVRHAATTALGATRPRLWRQLHWRRGKSKAVEAQRPTGTG